MDLQRLLLPHTITPEAQRTARGWLWLALVALAIAGVFSIFVAAARSPGTQALFANPHFFQLALTVHVNLSVLVWLLAISTIILTLGAYNAPIKHSATSRGCALLAWLAATLGCITMALAPFLTADAEAYLNNYVPMMNGNWFYAGILLFFAGIALQVLTTIIIMVRAPKSEHYGTLDNSLNYNAISGLAITLLVAFICGHISHYLLSASEVRVTLNEWDYYERLFWPMGHILQFTYLQAMLVAWVVMGGVIQMKFTTTHKRLINLAFLVNILAVLFIPFLLIALDPLDADYVNFFTQHMRMAAGISPLIIGGIIASLWFRQAAHVQRNHSVARYLLWSFILFFFGGALGLSITEINTTVPAHYHGSIVGITLALMGYTLLLLPQLGYADVTSWKLTRWQPVLYGGGQLIHITGLAWSGGYGALRKTPGAMQSIEGKMAMGLMGLGATIAIIGGICFVVILLKAIYRRVTIQQQ